mmetsp:Transcript_1950/g.7808  ORF Transcript_1950/g.7808 Transcript_1950/m.7808 type:complete len:292 (+) Transcript_1950:23-898(+)
MQVCMCCVRARVKDTAVLVAVQRRAPTSSGGLKINSRLPPSAAVGSNPRDGGGGEEGGDAGHVHGGPGAIHGGSRRPGGGEGALPGRRGERRRLERLVHLILARHLDRGAARVDGGAAHGGDQRGLEVCDESVLRRDRLRDLGVHLHLLGPRRDGTDRLFLLLRFLLLGLLFLLLGLRFLLSLLFLLGLLGVQRGFARAAKRGGHVRRLRVVEGGVLVPVGVDVALGSGGAPLLGRRDGALRDGVYRAPRLPGGRGGAVAARGGPKLGELDGLDVPVAEDEPAGRERGEVE